MKALWTAVARWVEMHPARAGTLAGWFQQGAGLFATFFALRLLFKAEILTEAEVGLWLSIQSMLTIVSLTDFGLGLVLARQAAFTFRQEKPNEQGSNDFIATSGGWIGLAELFQTGKRLFAQVNLAAVVIIVAGYHLVLPLGKMASLMSPSVMLTWYLAGLSAIVALQTKLYQGMLDGLGKVYIGRLITGISQFLMGVGIILVLKIHPALPLLGAVALCSSLLQYTLLRWSLASVSDGKLESSQVQTTLSLRQLWKIAAPLGVVSSAAYLVTNIQIPIIGMILGPKIVAPFYLAQRIGQVFMMAAMQFLPPQLPLFTQELASGKLGDARCRMIRTILIVSGVTLVLCGIYYLFSPLLVKWWIGTGHYVTNQVLGLMTLDFALLFCAGLWGQFVLASGRNPFMISTLANGVANLALALGFCSWLGLPGLPLASLISGLATNYWFVPLQGWKSAQSLIMHTK